MMELHQDPQSLHIFGLVIDMEVLTLPQKY